jgi:radical SAM superfamily enzyme YgiQ (UPF0313 family)
MKLMLLNPNYNWLGNRSWAIAPYGLILLQSQLPHHDSVVYDANYAGDSIDQAKNFIASESPDVILVTSASTDKIDEVALACKICRQVLPSSKIIVGGVIPTVIPEVVADYIDADLFFGGEADNSIVDMVEGRIPHGSYTNYTNYNGNAIVNDLNTTLPIRYDNIINSAGVITLTDYGNSINKFSPGIIPPKYPYGTIISSRGCPYRCLVGDTLILMGDGTSKMLKDINIGDKIIGLERSSDNRKSKYCISEVEAKSSTVRRAIKITIEDGNSVICSDDHRWLTDRGWKYTTGEMCGEGQRPYLTTNNYIRGIGNIYETPIETDDYKKGYITGVIEGDGMRREFKYPSGNNGYAFRLAMKDSEAVFRTRDYLSYFGIEVNTGKMRFYLNYKDDITDYYADVIRSGSRDVCNNINNITDRLSTSEFYRGYLAGIYDAEGGIDKSIIRIHNTDNSIISYIITALSNFNFKYIVNNRQGKDNIKSMQTVRITGGMAEAVRFTQIINPAISRKRASILGHRSTTSSNIVNIEELDIYLPMYDITTSTGNFIANGLISHNCNFCSAHTVSGKKVRCRSEGSVYAELDMLYDNGIRTFIFLDDHLLHKKRRAINIMNYIGGYKDASWKAANLAVWSLDDEVMDNMIDTGCNFMTLSLESGVQRVLDEVIMKPVNIIKANKIIKSARAKGFDIVVNFVIGSPGETYDEILQTIDYAANLDVDMVNFHIATPLPKTTLEKECIKMGIIDGAIDNRSFGYTNGIISTDEFTAEQIAELRYKEWDRINFSSDSRKNNIARLCGINIVELEEWRVRTRETSGLTNAAIIKGVK